MTKQTDSLRLSLVEAFLAAAAYGDYRKAGSALGINATTVSRRVVELEKWLHRVLITTDVPFSITEDGDDFVLIAAKVVELINRAGLKAEIGRTRVRPDGTVTVEGHKIDTDKTREIGAALVASRAKLDPDYAPPARVSGKDIDMSFFTPRSHG